MRQNNLKGIVLAGGKSLRFGEDKALAKIVGERLIEKPVRLLQSLTLEPVVIANETRNYSFLNCRIENDLIPGKGPLGGLYTAFQLFPAASLLVLTCDMPNITHSALEILLKAQQSSFSTVLFKSGKSIFQPFPGIYHSFVKDRIELCLKNNELSMQTFLKQVCDLNFVSPPKEASLFANINSQEDLTSHSKTSFLALDW